MLRLGLARRAQGAEPRQPLALEVEGAAQRLGELAVVHGHDAQPGFELSDLNLRAGELQVDGVHFVCSARIFSRHQEFLKRWVEKAVRL